MWGLLLTMYNVPERRTMYADVVQFYQERNVPLYIVDAANHGMPGVPSERQVCFDQHAQPEAEHCRTSTHWELLALQRFVHSPVFAAAAEKHRYLFKLTAKYKLLELQRVLDQHVGRFSPHYFVQHLQLGGRQNCEIVGFACARMPAQLQQLRALPGILEERLRRLLREHHVVARRLPPLRNAAPYRRGCGRHLHVL